MNFHEIWIMNSSAMISETCPCPWQLSICHIKLQCSQLTCKIYQPEIIITALVYRIVRKKVLKSQLVMQNKLSSFWIMPRDFYGKQSQLTTSWITLQWKHFMIFVGACMCACAYLLRMSTCAAMFPSKIETDELCHSTTSVVNVVKYGLNSLRPNDTW